MRMLVVADDPHSNGFTVSDHRSWSNLFCCAPVRIDRIGWQMFHASFAGANGTNPTFELFRANGGDAWFGWPNIPQVEAEVAAWYDATTLDAEEAVARRLNKV